MEPSSKTTSPTDRGRRFGLPLVVATAVASIVASALLARAQAVSPSSSATPMDAPTVPTSADSPPAQGEAAPATSPATAPAEAPAASPAGADGAAPPATEPPGAEATSPKSTEPGQRGPITVEADTLEFEKDNGARVHASGNVVVEWDTTKLRAADLKIDQGERRVEATGGIEYESDEMRASAASATIDVDDETGVLVDVNMHLEGETGRFGGSRLEKTEGRRVVLDDGYFTTCATDLGHPPDWELRGKRLDVRFDDYARMKSPRLEVRGVPVLYLPYLVFPTKQTRQSGLLPFSIGTSTNRGLLFTLPGYWAIDKHQDLTMTAVVETSARLGIDGLYRYAPSRRRWGEVHLGYYNEEIRGRPKPESPAVGVPDNRGAVELVHREYGSKWIGYADIQWVGDQRYLREIPALEGDAPERDVRRTRRYTASRAGMIASHGFTSGGIEAVAYQDLIGEVIDDGDSTTADPVLRDTQHKPFGGWIQTDRNVGPFALAVDSSLASFIREKGASGERLDVASTMALPLLVEGPIRSRVWANGRGSVYAMTERVPLDDQQQCILDDKGQCEKLDTFPTRGIFSTGIDARSKFARDYTFEEPESFSGLYHTLEPFAAIRYTNRSSYDDIPLFDRLDALDGRDVATYGIDSRFLLRRLATVDTGSNGAFELARLSLSQSYNLTRVVVDDHFSDIDIAAFVQPVEGFAVRTLTSWNVGASEVRGANASVSWETGPIGPLLRGRSTQIAAAYRYVRSEDATDDEEALQSTEMLARLGFTRNFALGLKALYDIVGNTFVEKAVGVTFTASCDCWSVGFGVVERVNPSAIGVSERGAEEELQVRLVFELKGLGGFGSGVTQRNSPALDSVEYDDIGFWRAGW